MSLNARLSPRLNHSLGVSTLNNTLNSNLPDDDDESSSSQSSQGHLGEVQLNGSYKENKGNHFFFFDNRVFNLSQLCVYIRKKIFLITFIHNGKKV